MNRPRSSVARLNLARFLIYRDGFGGCNSFKELGAELKPAVSYDVRDVSKTPHRPSVHDNLKRAS